MSGEPSLFPVIERWRARARMATSSQAERGLGGWSILMMSRTIILAGMVTVGLSLGFAPARAGRWARIPWGPELAGTRSLPLDIVRKRARFELLCLQGAELERSVSQIAWLPAVGIHRKYGARQAAAIWYRRGGGGATVLIQSPAIKGITARENVMEIMGAGVFYRNAREDQRLVFGTRHGTDFGIVSTELSYSELERLRDGGVGLCRR